MESRSSSKKKDFLRESSKSCDLRRGEIIGRDCRVTESRNRSQIGIEGRIVDETQNTIVLEIGDITKRIPKKGSAFIISDKEIKGDLLVGRPEDRIKKKFKKW